MDGIKGEILSFIKKHPMGVSIGEISEGLKKHRVTVTKYIFGLEGEGKIIIRNVGKAKLCYPKKK